MKTILVPTDFSKVSNNAVDYASRMAILTDAKLILFNVYHVPVVVSEIPAVIPDLDEMEKISMTSLKETEKRLLMSYGKSLKVESVCKCGFATDEIDLYAGNIKPDLIVMGMQGAGYITEKIIGSVTTALMQRSKYPVLAISEHVQFKTLKKIVLACDYNETENEKVLKPLKELARLFKSHIYVLNVVRELEPANPASQIVSDFIKLEHSLADVDHSFHSISTDEVFEGINEFVEMTQMDMVAMIPKKHTVLKNIFNEPNTKRMAFHTKLPLLALH